jgi:hypothetical protein
MVVTAFSATVAGGVAAQAPGPPIAGPALDREPQSIRITPENVRFSNYLHDLAAPRALIGVVGGGVLGQLRNNDDMGLADRIAEGATRQAVQVSVRHGLAALMHRSTDDHFEFCECRGFGPRVQHALIETFTDRRADGSRALAVPRIAGTYAGGFASLPFEHDRNVGDVAAGATLSLGFKALFNIGRELTGLGRVHAPDSSATSVPSSAP